MASYLVTGGAGFIGSHLAEQLVQRGERVRVLDNFQTGKRENLASFASAIELVEGDIRSLETCRAACSGMDYVLHQAALPSVPRSIEDPFTTNEVNILGTLNVLWAAAEAKVKRLTFASSSSVYGDDPTLPKKEGQEGKLLSPYAVSKFVGEKYLQVFAAIYGLETVSLRYFNIFGARQDPFSQYSAAIPLFITKMLKGEPPTIFGDGEQSRDFTYVDNVVEANLLACRAPGASGEAFNIACAERVTVNELARRIGRILGVTAKPLHAPFRPGEIVHSFADIGAAERGLGYRPVVSFDQGLAKTVAWYRDHSRL